MKKLILSVLFLLISISAFATEPITKSSGSFSTTGTTTPIILFTAGESALFRVTLYVENITQTIPINSQLSVRISYTSNIGNTFINCTPSTTYDDNWTATCTVLFYDLVANPIELAVTNDNGGSFTDEYTLYWVVEKVH